MKGPMITQNGIRYEISFLILSDDNSSWMGVGVVVVIVVVVVVYIS